MSYQFAQDLQLARRKAGLTQSDVAHLLDVSTKEISAYENGTKLPRLPELCLLSLVYGRSFESLFSELMGQGKDQIRMQLRSLPALKRPDVSNLNRESSLQRMERRVIGSLPSPYDGT